jgi:hypothetical protein
MGIGALEQRRDRSCNLTLPNAIVPVKVQVRKCRPLAMRGKRDDEPPLCHCLRDFAGRKLGGAKKGG